MSIQSRDQSNSNRDFHTQSNVTGAYQNSSANTINQMAANDRAIQRLDFYDFSDQELMNSDNKYRQYALAIDKALKSFEYTSEWADLVNALGKLNRVRTEKTSFRDKYFLQ